MHMETARIADQLRRSVEGEAWHGPCLQEALAGVTAEQAMAKPVAGAHSIWELLLHITAWAGAARKRLGGDPSPLSGEGDWPVLSGEWSDAIAAMESEFQALRQAVSALPDEDLTKTVPGQEYDNYFLLHGIVQHTLYHCGQILLLRRAM